MNSRSSEKNQERKEERKQMQCREEEEEEEDGPYKKEGSLSTNAKCTVVKSIHMDVAPFSPSLTL